MSKIHGIVSKILDLIYSSGLAVKFIVQHDTLSICDNITGICYEYHFDYGEGIIRVGDKTSSIKRIHELLELFTKAHETISKEW